MKLPKISLYKIIFSLLFFFAFLLTFNRQAFAYNPGQGEGEEKSTYSEQFTKGLASPSWEKSSFDFTTVNNIMESISTSILGSGDPNVDIAMGGSFVGKMGNLIVAMYANPPASSREYFADLGHRLKIVKPTYAQGTGFEGLKPILPIWTIFRNLAYVFFTIIFILTGFAIMFRLKINPQTVVTIQNALPKIIVSLILVTFSYAIAGLLIDLIYVGIALICTLLRPSGSAGMMNQNVFSLAHSMFGNLWEATKTVWGTIDELIEGLFTGTGAGGKILGFAAGTLGTAIIAVAIAFSLFKIFFTLLISYISIIAGVIFSPIMLMLEAVPGQKGLTNWLKLMISNIIPFPLVAAIFAIGGQLITKVSEGENLWVAPFLGTGSTTAYIPVLIGVAIIIAAPTVISTVQKSIGAPGIAGMAAGVMAPLATAGRLVSAPVRVPAAQIMAGQEKHFQEMVSKEGTVSAIRGLFRRPTPPTPPTPKTP